MSLPLEPGIGIGAISFAGEDAAEEDGGGRCCCGIAERDGLIQVAQGDTLIHHRLVGRPVD